MTVKLLFFAGSARKQSLNKRLAKAAMVMAEEHGAEGTFVDLKDYSMPVYCGDIEQEEGVPEAAQKLADIVRTQDGVFIASPEYNSTISPLLKNTLDWVSRLKVGGGDGVPPQTPWHGRYYSIGATSQGAMGGVRGLQTLSQTLINGFQLHVSPKTVAVPKGGDVLLPEGGVSNPQIEAMLSGAMQHFVRHAEALKS
jgi:NAD(P)H-dependent FMN reductase